jgi:hypothetical protein
MKAFKIFTLLIITLNSCRGQYHKTMENDLLSEYVSPAENAKVVVLFGGNPNRLDEVIRLLMQLNTLTIYGSLSEEDGMRKIKELKKVDLILIGGKYSNEQRMSIRSFVKAKLPNTKITEPGYDYPYSNDGILNDVLSKLQLTIQTK